MEEIEIILEKEKSSEVEIELISEGTIIYPQLENLTVTPSKEEQTFNHTDSYGYDEVTVEPINLQDKKLTLNENGVYNIKADEEYSGLNNVEVTLDAIEDLDAELNTYNEELTEQTTTIEDIVETLKGKGIIGAKELNVLPSKEAQVIEGIYNKVNVAGSETLSPENIKSGVDIFGVIGTGNMANFEITDASHLFYKNARMENKDELIALCKNLTSTEGMFYMAGRSNQTLDLTMLDVSQVTNMSYAFYACNYNYIDMSNWDTSKVENFSYMFNQNRMTEYDFSTFNTESATDFMQMFTSSHFKKIDISSWNTSNVEKMEYMFSGTPLEELNVSDIDVSNVKAFTSTFANLSKLPILDLSTWKNAKTTTYYGMFQNSKLLTTLDLSGFDASNVTITNQMLKGCTGLTNLTFVSNLGKAYKNTSANSSNTTLDLSDCKNLTHDSLVDVINKLYDLNLTYDVANGGTLKTQKLVLGATNIAKLTSDELSIATAKGWVIS